ncbi:MAG TPA: hypothetical protein DHN33_06635 [Eubacteriaceae bacterium]|nr:hypothetical protein [Eubacteriaceae bacterium]
MWNLKKERRLFFLFIIPGETMKYIKDIQHQKLKKINVCVVTFYCRNVAESIRSLFFVMESDPEFMQISLQLLVAIVCWSM